MQLIFERSKDKILIYASKKNILGALLSSGTVYLPDAVVHRQI